MAPEKFRTAAEREQDAYEGAHGPLQRQPTSAELAEEGTNPLAGPVLAPEAGLARRDPNLDPNVKRSVTTSTAGPARTETTRAVAREAGLVNEATADSPRSSVNSNGFTEDLEARRERIRKENESRASAPNTTPNPAEQTDDGKTKPEVAKAMKEADAKVEADEKAKAKAEADAAKA